MTASRPSLCLCMIVKDEAPVVARCLASVAPVVDSWLVVDTGSTDGTQALVRGAMAGAPGRLVERPGRDFAHNRSEALELARGLADYSLVIDADDELLLPPDPFAGAIFAERADAYTLAIRDTGVDYRRTQVFSNARPWRYRGVLHEFPDCEGTTAVRDLPWAMRRNHDGRRRRDPETYRRDATLLASALEGEPDPFMRARHTFYLAQSWRDCGEQERALAAYLERATLGFWDQERFVALLEAARLQEALGRSPDEVLATYAQADATCAGRAEAAHGAARLCRQLGRHEEGYGRALPARDLAAPPNGLFVEPWVYAWGLKDELAIHAYWTGRWRESLDACLDVLAREDVPADARGRVAANARFAARKLAGTAMFGMDGVALQQPVRSLRPAAIAAPMVLRTRSASGRISLITPTGGREDFLPIAWANVQAQDHPDLEWLVLDDGAYPSSFMRELDDPRVTYLHSAERLPIGEKRNQLVERATGEVVIHLDDDDWYAPGYVSAMAGRLQSTGADLLNLRGWFLHDLRTGFFGYWDLEQKEGAHYRCDADGVSFCVFGPEEAQALGEVERGYGFTYCYRRSLWRAAPFPAIDWNEDGEFARAAAARNARLGGVHDRTGLCLHVLHPQSTSRCFPQYRLPPGLMVELLTGYKPGREQVDTDEVTPEQDRVEQG